MNGSGVSLAEAARLLGRSPGAIRRWVRSGAPCVSHGDGQGGRGKGSTVDPAALAAWYTAQRLRSGSATRGDVGLERLAELLRSFHRSDALDGVPAWRLVGIGEEAAARLMVLFYRFAFLQEHGEPPEPNEYPPEIESLIASASERE